MMIIITIMRYPPATKERTRRKIVTAASQTFRREGMGKAAVAKVMKRAGLTHGGFYAHFHGKDALAAEVFAEAFHALGACAKWWKNGSAPVASIRFIRVYLSAWHRDHPDEGCLLAPLTGDLAREPRNGPPCLFPRLRALCGRARPDGLRRGSRARRSPHARASWPA